MKHETRDPIPKGWETKTIEQLVEDGRAIGYGVLKPGPHVNGGVRLLKSNQIQDGWVDLTNDYRISTGLDEEFKRTRLSGGELLLNVVGSIGRSAIAPIGLKGANVSRAIAVLPLDKSRARWIQLFLSSPKCQADMFGRKVGIAQPVLNLGQVRQLPIPLPPLREQRQIVMEIEKQFTRQDAGVAALRRVQANLKRYRTAVLKSACEGKLLSGKTALYAKQPLSELGKWCGGGTPSKANPTYWTSGNIPWVSPKDMKTEVISDAEDHITKDAIENSSTNLIPKNAVLVVTRSGILQHTLPVAVTMRPVALNQDLKALQLLPAHNSRYVALALRAHQREILQHCTKAGTTVQSIEFPVFLRFEIPVPPLKEQTRLVDEVERRLSVVEELETFVQTNLQRATRLRQSILQRAFTGDL